MMTVNRPKVMERIEPCDLGGSRGRFQASTQDDDSIRGVILTGAGDKAFIAAGADISELARVTAVQAGAVQPHLGSASSEPDRKPRKAGDCRHQRILPLGGGCENRDGMHNSASPAKTRRFWTTREIKHPDLHLLAVEALSVLPRLVVARVVRLQLILTGEMIGAAEAYRIGLGE